MSIRVGLVGAGHWAATFHAPMIRDSPHTTLTAVWARRPEAAAELAVEHGATAVDTVEELLELVDAVAFAVPPDVQAEIAPQAARAGKHLVLEKPLALDLASAEAIADAADEAGVSTVVVLRNRFTNVGRTFVQAARGAEARGAQGSYVTSGALEGSPFATPWRVERGAVLDVGPHVLDLLDAALGPVQDVRAEGDPTHWVSLTTHHEGGAVGQAALSITTPNAANLLRVEVWTETGPVVFDGAASDAEEGVGLAIVEALAVAIEHGRDGELGVRRGVHLQRLLDEAEAQLG